MFIRKDERYLIQPIEEVRTWLNQKEVTPEVREVELFKNLLRLDTLVGQGAEWDEIETLLSSIKDTFRATFRNWLSAKGIEEPLADDLDRAGILRSASQGVFIKDGSLKNMQSSEHPLSLTARRG
jgi:hypothetical protein